MNAQPSRRLPLRRLTVYLGVLLAAWEAGAAAQTLPLDGAWEFRRTDGAAAGAWQTIRVPHDWAIAGPFEPEASPGQGKLPWQGKGEYRRSFRLGADAATRLAHGARAFLELDGAMARPSVTVNGAPAGEGDYGYLGLVLDVTERLREGSNDVCVAVTTQHQRTRFYCGGGLYRSVRLVLRDPDHVVPGSLAITTPEVTPEHARVRIAYTSSLRGDQVEERVVERPRLWDVGQGNLYEVELLGERFRYGIRTFAFDAQRGFLLNGRRVQLKGVNLHADLGPVGMAFDRDLAKRQLLTMLDMGCNALRTSHNCPDPQVLDLCDELGIVVWDECFDKWEGTSGRLPSEPMEAYVERTLARFVRRDRLHPSVVAWSIGNEIWKEGAADPWNNDAWGETGMNAERFRRFRAAIRREDATRPVGIGCCGEAGAAMFAELDLTGWNYGAKYADHRAGLPQQPVVYTESASAVSEYGFYGRLPAGKTDYARDVLRVSSYDYCAAPWSDIPDVEFRRMETDRYCAGEFVWTGIDYLGEPTPIVNDPAFGINTNASETARSSYFGIVDLTGVPKDRFYLYRSLWNDRAATVRLCPSHWNFSAPQPVFVYTSGDSAELFLNGRSLGRRRKGEAAAAASAVTNAYYDVCRRYRLQWFDVPAEPGELKAVAYRGDAVLGEDVVRTAGAPAALRLRECPYDDPAAKTRVTLVEAVDARGVPHPHATARVAFALEGPGTVIAVGNGNPRGYDSFAAVASHPLHCGRCAVYVRRTGPGRLTLCATAPGLRPGRIELPDSAASAP